MTKSTRVTSYIEILKAQLFLVQVSSSVISPLSSNSNTSKYVHIYTTKKIVPENLEIRIIMFMMMIVFRKPKYLH